VSTIKINALSASKVNPLWAYLLVILLAALPLFAHLDDLPVQLFDEQRLATNSLELNQSGNFIVTTYEGQPDYSNTKPPLMIWLQAASMRIFGNNELAIRLPSALAALATCLLIFNFCSRRLKSPLTGLCSVLVLLTSQGYITLHGTRTGDYDALLTLFTTAYFFSYYSFLEDERPKYLYATFLFLMFAVMTKCVAACLMLPALFIYTIWLRKIKMILSNRHFYMGLAILIIPVASYYLYRQHLDPGYFKAVAEMDLGGRYLHALSFPQGPGYYILLLLHTSFVPWLCVSISGIVAGIFLNNRRLKRISVYAAFVSVIYLVIISASVTKFYWYLLPVFPPLAILAGILILSLYNIARTRLSLSNSSLLTFLFIGLLVVFAWPYYNSVAYSLNPQTEPSMMENGMMAYFMKDALHGRRDIKGMSVAIEGYEGNVRWYFLALKAKGQTVPVISDLKFAEGQTVIAFQRGPQKFITEHFITTEVENFRGVMVYKILSKRG